MGKIDVDAAINAVEQGALPDWIAEPNICYLRKHQICSADFNSNSFYQVQRFVNVPAAVHNLFNLGRNLVSAHNYRFFRSRTFSTWDCAAA